MADIMKRWQGTGVLDWALNADKTEERFYM